MDWYVPRVMGEQLNKAVDKTQANRHEYMEQYLVA